eukprot:m51a1_g2404 putative atp-dependent dna helicase q-like 3 (691) ;mRNA; r:768417-771908
MRNPLIHRASFNRPNISYSVRYKDILDSPFDDLTSLVIEHKDESGIIYCIKRETCESIAGQLERAGVSCKAYHGKLDPSTRSQVQEDWKAGKTRVVVATIAFGMGIDKRDVRLVVHFEMPKCIESFYQESGRAGRDGNPSESVVYYGESDVSMLKFVISQDDKVSEERKQLSLEELEKPKCRRAALLNHFGETTTAKSRAVCCDFCSNPEDVRKTISKANSRGPRERDNGRGYRKESVEDRFIDDGGFGGFRSARDADDRMEDGFLKPKSSSGAFRPPRIVDQVAFLRATQEQSEEEKEVERLKHKRKLEKSAETLADCIIDRGNTEQIKDMSPSSRGAFFQKIMEALASNPITDGMSEEDRAAVVAEIEYKCFANAKQRYTYFLACSKEIKKIEEATSKNLCFTPEVAAKPVGDLEDSVTRGNTPAILKALGRLSTIPMTLEILRETKVGVVVGKLRKTSGDTTVAAACAALVDAWRPLAPSPSPPAAAAAPAPARGSSRSPSSKKRASPDSPSPSPHPKKSATPSCARDAAVTLLRSKLGERIEEEGEREPEEMAREIEAALASTYGSDAGTEYKNRLRTIAMNLGEASKELRNSVMRGAVTPERLVTMTTAEMAPSGVKEWRKKVEREALKEAIGMTVDDLASTDQFECPRCHKRKASYTQLQTRSADEPMTTFIFCHICKYRWKMC